MRRALALLPLGLLLLAVAEIAVFVAVVHAIGAGWTLLLLAATSVLGLVLLRRGVALGVHDREVLTLGKPRLGEELREEAAVVILPAVGRRRVGQ